LEGGSTEAWRPKRDYCMNPAQSDDCLVVGEMGNRDSDIYLEGALTKPTDGLKCAGGWGRKRLKLGFWH
jgi:hypothetical protein